MKGLEDKPLTGTGLEPMESLEPLALMAPAGLADPAHDDAPC